MDVYPQRRALAALGVFGTEAGWPDVIVTAIMGILALQGAATVIMHAMTELRSTGPVILPQCPAPVAGEHMRAAPVAVLPD